MTQEQINNIRQGLGGYSTERRFVARHGKKPINPMTGYDAKANDPSTWGTFEQALSAVEKFKLDGIGVELGDGLRGIDLDHCINEHGDIAEQAQDIISTMAGGYVETSPSGTGIHILFAGSIPEGSRRKGNVEMYAEGRYFTLTGNGGGVVEDRTQQAAQIHSKYLSPERDNKPSQTGRVLFSDVDDDRQLIAKAHSAKNGTQFGSLWNGDTNSFASESEADLSLCNHLAFWTACDAGRMDKLFRESGLYREKWDRRQSGSTYGALTIQKAIHDCGQTYNPQAHFQKKSYGIKIGTGRSEIKLSDLHPDKNERYGWNDIGNGNLFADWFKDKARYVPERKKWFIYNGKLWQPDTGDLKVMELCKDLADNLMIYALGIEDERQRQVYIASVQRWQKRSYRETVLKDAASVYPVEISEFDKNQYLFNCLNGTVDLSTGAFHSHRAEDMLSKLSGVKYNPEAKSERWERFIDEIMQNSLDKATFLQKALGYALTGDTRHECFFILYGPSSRNGKGSCMETYSRLMGDYGKTAKPDTIAQKQTANGSGPSEDIARLAGARFVNISEPDKKMTLSASLVKTLTGNDTITARFLNENSFEYRPQFKLFINTNHLPAVTDTTLFSSGRVKIIPFERHFTEADRDEGLKAELAKPDNLSGILNWCIQGLKLIAETGFKVPDAVREATDEYRKNNDKIGRFLDDEMKADALAETRTSDVYSHYKMWCGINGFFPENAANFKSSLSNVSTVVRKRPADGGGLTTLLQGYRIKSEFARYESPL